MNYDEFGFFNQQLAAMLRDGIPLEGALKQLSAGMRSAPLRSEIEALDRDLSSGVPLKEALSKRNLPEFYKRMVEAGVRSNDLPGMLVLLADHYHRANVLWTRLKGLMVYPAIVVLVSLGLTVLLSLLFSHYLKGFFNTFEGMRSPAIVAQAPIIVWVPPILLAVLATGVAAILSVPSWRNALRWRLPAFREASLAQLASAMALMLHKGTTLPEALALAEGMEAGTPARGALAQWRSQIEAGSGKPSQWPAAPRPFPPMFLWLIQKGGENAEAGFEQAAEIYQRRASYRIELALYGALPISILFLGQMIFWQIAPLLSALIRFMNMLGDMGGS